RSPRRRGAGDPRRRGGARPPRHVLTQEETEMTAPQIDAPRKRDDANWASPVDRLSATHVPGARDDAVTGKRVTGPLQGFGQLWQKTFRVPLDGVDLTP